MEASKDGANKDQILRKARFWTEDKIDEFISYWITIGLLQSYTNEKGELVYKTTERGLHCLRFEKENKKLLEPYYAPRPRGIPSWFPF